MRENLRSRRSKNGDLTRLKSIQKELLYKIFCIDNQPFVALILKMQKQLAFSKNKFLFAKDQKVNIYKSEQILIPLTDFIYAVDKNQMNFNFSADTKEEKIKAEEVILLAVT